MARLKTHPYRKCVEMINIDTKTKKIFRTKLLQWYKLHKREFPWRECNDPYGVLIAEALLQKTNAEKVADTYPRFLAKYPNIQSLSNARAYEVKRIIAKLGLLYRAPRLVKMAKQVVAEFGGTIPADKGGLLTLIGLGEYISASVACFAFNKHEPILDTNVVRVIERVFGVKSKKERQRDDREYWALAAQLLPQRKCREYNYALLDFSALQCTARNPNHKTCPLRSICHFIQKKSSIRRKPLGVDLFAGAGGLSLGFEQAGFNIRYAVENDKNAAETYRRNREKKKDLFVDTRDIKDIKPKDILKNLGIKRGELDIVIGGPPCQGFSQSNMRTRNLANPQNQLVFKFIEFVNALQPKWFLMENVAGLNSLDNGKLTELLLDEFDSIGYLTKSILLNSVNFGVPQSRNRIFFVGNKVGNKMECVSNLINQSIRKPVTVKEAISDLPRVINGNTTNEMEYSKRKSSLTSFQKKMRQGMNGNVQNNLTTKHNDLAITRFKNIKQGENLLSLAKNKPEMVSNYKNIQNCHHWIYMRLSLHKPSVTLNNFRKNMLIHPTQNRGLSVREAARLQSFPDCYVFFGSIGHQQQQVSNAVPVMLAQIIATDINTAGVK